MHSLVLDTNVLIDGVRDKHSASWQIVEKILEGTLVAFASVSVQREYTLILSRLVRDAEYESRMQEFLQVVRIVKPAHIGNVVTEDAEDNKILAAAVAASADVLVSSDHHLRSLDPYGTIRILTPQECMNHLRDESDSSWSDFARSIGIS